ncbi:SPOR domain-containing protein [Sulfitobacter sp. SK012]|nr:SPOR domain-containing protein [Sulfitobacter sp. SK012]
MAYYRAQGTSTEPRSGLTTLTNTAGALVSLALIAGIGVWGYKIFVRDVSGIPVVRAAEGEMRILPDNPGGQLAQHQGLSVNEVASVGASSTPVEELRLAPKPIELSDEDQPMETEVVADAPQAVAEETQAEAVAVDVAAALQAGTVDDLVAQLTRGVAPLEEIKSEETAPEVTPVLASVAAEVPAVIVTGPGPRSSLRPRNRPAADVIQASLQVPADVSSESAEIDISTLPAGTRLVQLGAFDSPEIAREQWVVLQRKFSAYLGDKQRIVQQATSGGRTFYRLRAHGFSDISDARRFCSALTAQNADCIPVVTR